MTLAILIICLLLWTLNSIYLVRKHNKTKLFSKGQDMILYADISMLKDMGATPTDMSKYYIQFLKDTLTSEKYEKYIKDLCRVNDVTHKTMDGKVTAETLKFLTTSLTYDAQASYDHIEYYMKRRKQS